MITDDILALAGASRMSMDMMNVRIEREIRNQENRATNCETGNIAKAVKASQKCRQAIERIMGAGRFEALSAELRETATLRMENPAANLTELAELHNPPITKSGLNHRLQKIIAFADSIGGEE